MSEYACHRTGAGWRARRNRRSGQAMTEALIMLSLLGFAWMVASWMTFLGENRVRLSSSVRHTAWKLGHHLGPTDPHVEFYNVPPVGMVEVLNNNDHDVATPVFSPPSQPIDFSFLKTLKPNILQIHEREAILNVQAGNTGKFFDSTLKADLPFMPGKLEPTVIGDPNAAWPDMFEYLDDRQEIMDWIKSGT